jgi:hypothetical protein
MGNFYSDVVKFWKECGKMRNHSAGIFFPRARGKLSSQGVCVYMSTSHEGNLLDSYLVSYFVLDNPSPFHASLHSSRGDSCYITSALGVQSLQVS